MKHKPIEIKDFYSDPFWSQRVKADCCGKIKRRKDAVQIQKDPKRVMRDSVFCDDFSTFETVCIGKCD